MPQPHEGRDDPGLEAVEVRGHEPPPLGIGNGSKTGARGEGVANVPVEIAEGAGVAEALKRSVEPAEDTADASADGGRAADAGHRHAGQPADEAQRMTLTGRPSRVRQVRAGHGRDDAWQRQVRGSGLDMLEKRRLEGHGALGLSGVHDLEGELTAGRSHVSVLIALAVERRGLACDPEVREQQAAHGLRGEGRARMTDEAHGIVT